MLSDYEREQLALIERHLTADGLHLATHDGYPRGRARGLMVLVGLVGMAVVIGGVALNNVLLGLGGFALMLLGAVVGLRHPDTPTVLPAQESGPSRFSE